MTDFTCGIACLIGIFAILVASSMMGANPSMPVLDANSTDSRSEPEHHDVYDHHTKTEVQHGLEDCGIWLAPSTIPGGGLGMFAGRDFGEDEPFLSTGDIVIPVVDMGMYLGDRKFIFEEYQWSAEIMGSDNEAFEVSAVSPGFGSVANSVTFLANADQQTPEADNAGLHRSRDPGAGAFTAYHNRQTIAYDTVEAGDELLVDYGDDWFLSREEELGPIPIESDIDAGEDLLDKFWDLRERMEGTESVSLALLQDVWETFVLSSPFRESSRVLNAFPDTWSETEEMRQKGLRKKRREDHRQSVEWIREHGTCADNMEVRPSTIRQAGRGAFAVRHLPKDSIVAPVPLIHLPNREVLDIYDFRMDKEANITVADKTRPPIGKQLLLNYCMGHSESTLLLCPYGVHTGFVNHNQTQANVRLQWADPTISNHQSEWLNLTIEELDQMEHAGLAMELVATRDIHPGDEIFLDYGQEWEDAWNNHVKSWKPFTGSEKHQGSHEMNSDQSILPTVFEEMVDPSNPKDVELKCRAAFVGDDWKKFYPDNLDRLLSKGSRGLTSCDITSREEGDEGRVLYNAVLRDSRSTRLSRVPREAFRFVDHPYTSEIHLPNAFRHELMIPDDIFPELWRNAR